MSYKKVSVDPVTGLCGFTALSTDTLPAAPAGSWCFYTDKPGTVVKYNGETWHKIMVGGAALFVTDPPETRVTPTKPNESDVATGVHYLTALTGNIIRHGRVSIQPPSDVAAATRLANATPSVHFLTDGERLQRLIDSAVTRAYICGVSDVSNPQGHVIAKNAFTATFTAANATEEGTVSGGCPGTGTAVTLSTTGTLPAGWALSTVYYVIRSSDTVFQLASTYANAIAGTAVAITDDGTGTHTITEDLTETAQVSCIELAFDSADVVKKLDMKFALQNSALEADFVVEGVSYA